MDLNLLLNNPVLITACAGSFVFGVVLARLFSGSVDKTSKSEDPRNHRIRELEADLRTLRRQFEECEQALDAKNAEFETTVETLREVRTTLAEREQKLEDMKAELKGSVAKTRELRQELQDRATETIKVNVRAEEAETELEVARAGSEAVLSEISRLQEEQKNLTDTMRNLEESMVPDEVMFGDDSRRRR